MTILRKKPQNGLSCYKSAQIYEHSLDNKASVMTPPTASHAVGQGSHCIIQTSSRIFAPTLIQSPCDERMRIPSLRAVMLVDILMSVPHRTQGMCAICVDFLLSLHHGKLGFNRFAHSAGPGQTIHGSGWSPFGETRGPKMSEYDGPRRPKMVEKK